MNKRKWKELKLLLLGRTATDNLLIIYLKHFYLAFVPKRTKVAKITKY